MGPPPGMPPQQQAQHGPPGMAPPQGFAPPMVRLPCLAVQRCAVNSGSAVEEARHAGWQHVVIPPRQQHLGTPSPLTPACLALCLSGPASRPACRRHAAPAAAAPGHGRPSGHAHAAPASGHGWRAHGSAPGHAAAARHAAAAGHAARPHAGDYELTAALCGAVHSDYRCFYTPWAVHAAAAALVHPVRHATQQVPPNCVTLTAACIAMPRLPAGPADAAAADAAANDGRPWRPPWRPYGAPAGHTTSAAVHAARPAAAARYAPSRPARLCCGWCAALRPSAAVLRCSVGQPAAQASVAR